MYLIVDKLLTIFIFSHCIYVSWCFIHTPSLNDSQSRSSFRHPWDWQPVEIKDDRWVSCQPGISWTHVPDHVCILDHYNTAMRVVPFGWAIGNKIDQGADAWEERYIYHGAIAPYNLNMGILSTDYNYQDSGKYYMENLRPHQCPSKTRYGSFIFETILLQ